LHELMGVSREELLAIFEPSAASTLWPEDPREIKLSSLVGTWLARRALGLTGLAPLPAEGLDKAVAALQAGLKGPLSEELAASCRALADPAEAALAGDMLRAALEALDRQLRLINPRGGVDPRFVGGLVVER
jgi:hypothetical protein